MVQLIRTLLALLVAIGLLSGHAPLAAQGGPVYLEPGHWTWDALRRLSTAGLVQGSASPVWAPVTMRHAAAAFDTAAAAAERADRPALVRQARAYAELLREESDPAARRVAAAAVRLGWAAARGDALGGDGFYVGEDWEGAQPLPAVSAPVLAVEAQGHIAPWLSWSANAGRVAGAWSVPLALVGFRVGAFDAWAGRQRLHYGVGHGGGTVIGGGRLEVQELVPRTQYIFEGAGIALREPFRYPGIFRFMGASRIEMTAGRLDRVGHVERPYVVFGRLMSTPFSERFTIGINRGAIFAGEGIPITAGRLLGLLAGVHGGEHGEFENQVFSALAHYRPPLGRLPAAFYLEWGMDDTSGAVRDTPGTVVGIELGPLPGVPALSFGVEHTYYPGSWRGKPPWYRNVFYRGSWADEGRLFAHPLGGHGRELLGHARVDLPERGLFVGAEMFARQRRFENLFAPERQGSSRGGTLSVVKRVRAGTTLRMEAGFERGDGWNAGRFAATARQNLTGASR
jgi:hypothetical protein